MTTATKPRSVLVGAGRRSRAAHAPVIAEMTDLRTVIDSDYGRALRLGHPVETGTDYQTYLYDLPKREVAYVILQPQHTFKVALDHIEAGKHVFVEKPPGTGIGEVRALARAAKQNDVLLGVAFQRRFIPGLAEARDRVLARGMTYCHISYHKHYVGDPQPNQLWEDGCHGVDLARFLTGDGDNELLSVHQVNEDWHIRFGSQMYGGKRAYSQVDMLRSAGKRVFQGELHGYGISVYFEIPGRVDIFEDGVQTTFNANETDDALRAAPIRAMHEHFLDAVSGRTSLHNDIHEAARTFELIDHAQRRIGYGDK